MHPRNRKLLLQFVLQSLFLCYPAAALSLGTLKGTVSDPEGAAIGKTHILIRYDASGSKNKSSKTDIQLTANTKGNFKANLAPGFYDVCVMADAFTPQCQKVFVGAGTIVSRRVRLQADPGVVKRLADKF